MGMYTIKMPDIGEGIAEVELVAWRVQPGEAVKEDQILADVMTDKATVEIPSPVAGKVAALGGEPGQVMAVGSELIRLEVEGEGNVKAGSAPSAAEAAVITPAAVERRANPPEVSPPSGGRQGGGQPPQSRHPSPPPEGEGARPQPPRATQARLPACRRS